MTIFSRIRKPSKITSIIVDPEFGEIQLTRVNALRSIRVVVEPFTGIHIKMPHRIPKNQAIQFINKKRSWLRAALQRVGVTEEKSRNHFASLDQTSRKTIRSVLVSRLSELAELHGFTFNQVSIRNQKSRWGSCSSNNNISLNQKLYYLPAELRDYVLVHELAHTREKNHGTHFWNILFRIYGSSQTKLYRQRLKDYDFLFFPPPEVQNLSD